MTGEQTEKGLLLFHTISGSRSDPPFFAAAGRNLTKKRRGGTAGSLTGKEAVS